MLPIDNKQDIKELNPEPAVQPTPVETSAEPTPVATQKLAIRAPLSLPVRQQAAATPVAAPRHAIRAPLSLPVRHQAPATSTTPKLAPPLALPLQHAPAGPVPATDQGLAIRPRISLPLRQKSIAPSAVTQLDGKMAQPVTLLAPRATQAQKSSSLSKITDYLYIGDMHAGKSAHEHGMTHVVNCISSQDGGQYERQLNVRYLDFPMRDSADYNISEHFPEAFAFIAQAQREQGKVLVHCQAGKSRSATIVIGYLMKFDLSFNRSYEATLKYVKSKREAVDPIFGFLIRLSEFESKLIASSPSSPPVVELDGSLRLRM